MEKESTRRAFLRKGVEAGAKLISLSALLTILENCASTEQNLLRRRDSMEPDQKRAFEEVEMRRSFEATRADGENYLSEQVFDNRNELAYVYSKKPTTKQGHWQGTRTDEMRPENTTILYNVNELTSEPLEEFSFYHTHPIHSGQPSKNETISLIDLRGFIEVILKWGKEKNFDKLDFRVVVPSGMYVVTIDQTALQAPDWDSSASQEMDNLMRDRLRLVIDNTHNPLSKGFYSLKNIRLNQEFAEKNTGSVFKIKFEPADTQGKTQRD